MPRHNFGPRLAMSDRADHLAPLNLRLRFVVRGEDTGSMEPCHLPSQLIRIVKLARASDFNQKRRSPTAQVPA